MVDRTRDADLLAAYEAGLLDEEAMARFEAALLEDPDLLEELYDHAPAAEALRAEPQRYLAALKRGAARAPRSAGLLHRLRDLLRPRVLVPVAAVFAVALALFVGSPDQAPLLGDLADLTPAPYARVDLRAGARDVDAAYRAAMDRYLALDWAGAAADLEAALALDAAEGWSHADPARLYLGVSHVLADAPDAALAPLRTAAESPLLAVSERARWWLVQAHLRRDDADAAAELLAALAESPVYGARATAQLAELEARRAR